MATRTVQSGRKTGRARRTNHLTRQLQALGYQVQLTPTTVV